MHAFAKPLHQISEIRRDEHGRILPSVMLPAHQAMQQLCESNTEYYRSLDLHAASGGRLSPRSAPDSPVAAATGQSFSAGFSTVEAPNKSMALPASDTPPESEPLTVFTSKVLPRLSLFELAFALNRTTQCGGEALMVALVLMWRYCVAKDLCPTAHMMHRLYTACLHVGVKTHSDVYYRNACYAKLAGITLAELNRLEIEVLTGLDWHTLVQPVEIVAIVMAPKTLITPRLLVRNRAERFKGLRGRASSDDLEFHDEGDISDSPVKKLGAGSLASSLASSWSKLPLATSASTDSVDGHYVSCPTPPRNAQKATHGF